MTRDEAVTIIQQQLGFRTDLTASIITTMKLAQQQLEVGPTLPWFLLSEKSFILTAAEEERVPVPTEFIEEYEESALVYVPDDTTAEHVILGKRDLDTLLKEFSSVNDPAITREPQFYAIRGVYFILFPTPDDIYRIQMTYYKKGLSLDTNIENVWLKHIPYLLIGKTGGMLPAPIKTDKMMVQFQTWENEGRLTIFGKDESRTHTGRDDYAMGGCE